MYIYIKCNICIKHCSHVHYVYNIFRLTYVRVKSCRYKPTFQHYLHYAITRTYILVMIFHSILNKMHTCISFYISGITL